MEKSLIELLKIHPLFSSLDEKTRNHLAPQFTRLEVKANEVLFHQGEASSCLFLVEQGKLVAETMTPTLETYRVGYIESGEVIGELGALSNEPRSLTVKTLRPSVLWKLPAKEFIHICYQYPAVMFAAIHPMINRSKNIFQLLAHDKKNRHIV